MKVGTDMAGAYLDIIAAPAGATSGAKRCNNARS